MLKKLVVLTHSSLLAAGLISRLAGYARQFEILVVDLREPNSLQRVSDFKPEIIIFDEADIKNCLHPSLADFLDSLPDAILFELRLEDPNVQMIQSVRFSASSADELVQILKTSSHTAGLSSQLFV
jgi:hypothetical protein